MIRETSAQRVSEFSKLVAHHRLLNRPEVVLLARRFQQPRGYGTPYGITVENINAYLKGREVGHTCT